MPNHTLPAFAFKGLKELNGPANKDKEPKEIDAGYGKGKSPAQSDEA
jgi:hypothetical protein